LDITDITKGFHFESVKSFIFNPIKKEFLFRLVVKFHSMNKR